MIRILISDHGYFVVINVYVPNAGEKPERPRYSVKMQFLNNLLNKASQIESSGKKVI